MQHARRAALRCRDVREATGRSALVNVRDGMLCQVAATANALLHSYVPPLRIWLLGGGHRRPLARTLQHR
eukprot:9472867-Pyramimonas_sp.AAC.1